MAENNNIVGKIETVSRKFKWVINNFSITGSKNVGEYVESPRFVARSDRKKIQWHLILHPNGDCDEGKGFLSLFLSANAEITAAATLEILNNKNEAVLAYRTGEAVFRKLGKGYRQFVSRKNILQPRLGKILNDDKLTIVCEITYPADGEKIEEEIKAEKNNEKKVAEDKEIKSEEKETEKQYNLSESTFERLEEFDKYEALMYQEEFSDVSLIVEDKVVKVHKCILAKSSTVFATMFRAEMKETQDNTVEIADIKYDVLVEMIRYVYAGKVKNIDAIADQLASAADKYALDGLTDICEKTMCKNVSVDNAVESLKIADRHRMDKLKMQTIDFVIQNAENITNQPEFKFLPFDVVCEICCALAKNNKNKQ